MGEACDHKEACLQMDGLMKCSIVLPKRLYHPVFPYRSNKKLLFCLCRSRVLQQNTCRECRHTSDVQRALTGTWVIAEVRLAVEKGYKFLEIYEEYHYQVTQYNPEITEGRLFVDYINTFLKLKAERAVILAGFIDTQMKTDTFNRFGE